MAMRRMFPTAAQSPGHNINFAAPVGGWNARDPLIDMPAKDAVYLENFFPRGTSVDARKGCAQIAALPADTALDPHRIRTLMGYSDALGHSELFAACEDGIYDITDGLAVPSTPVAADTPVYGPDTTNAVWEWCNVSTAGGSFLLAVNGTDDPIMYDGEEFTNPTYTGVSDAKYLTSITSYKARLYFTYADSLSFYYSGVNSIAGALSEFPLHVLCAKGGYLVGIMNWTYATSLSVTERIAMITSEGQVVVYEGYDPSNSAYWSLVGVFDLPRPIGRRCLVKMGGDVGILTENGLIMLSQSLRSIAPGLTTCLSDKIRLAYKSFASTYGATSGWEMCNHTAEGMLLITVPKGMSAARDNYAVQLVLNTVSGGWTLFSGWNPTACISFGGKLYFASGSKVYIGLYGQDDAGAVIQARAKTAFMYMGAKGRNKQIALVKPNFTVSGTVAFKLGIDTDFQSDNIALSSTSYGDLTGGAAAYWDSALWDSAKWDIETTQAKWRTVSSRPGGYISFRLSLQLKDTNLTWNAVDCIMAVGGVL